MYRNQQAGRWATDRQTDKTDQLNTRRQRNRLTTCYFDGKVDKLIGNDKVSGMAAGILLILMHKSFLFLHEIVVRWIPNFLYPQHSR